MRIFGFSDKGSIRTDNQDSFIYGELFDGSHYAIVCDGMGGVSGGSVASDIAVKAFKEEIEKKYHQFMSVSEMKRLIKEAVNVANSIIFEISSKETALSGMGTTIVFAIIIDGTAYITHIGDSRAYHIRDNKAIKLTKDHSFVQEMLDLGQLTTEEAKNHPKKNIITKALGVQKHIEGEFTTVNLEDNDILLLCTDGLTNYVEDEEIPTLIEYNDLEFSVNKCIKTAMERGGSDNITLILLAK